jgi:D-inositol-3-phosphate glycosyltransferase
VVEPAPKKIKLLAWGDYCCATGFGNVLGNIVRQLHATGRYDIDVLAINYTGDPYDRQRWPGNVYPAMPGVMSQSGRYADVYGRQRLCDMAGQNDYDVVFMLTDTFILQTVAGTLKQTQEILQKDPTRKTFKTVFYFPVDSLLKRDWVEGVVDAMDFPVVYTKFGRREVAKIAPQLADMPVIYHGTNVTDFHYIEDRAKVKKLRHEYWHGKADDRFLIVNVNRNQPRKDISRTLMVMKELNRRGRKPLLYLHMQHSDIGGNIFVMCDQLGIAHEDVILPHPNIFNANQGLPIERVNEIYNAADMLLTTTLGEGWGLSITEAFATKTPVVGPNNTALTEIMADNRGILIPSGNTPSMFKMDLQDNERIRPLMDITLAAAAIEELMDGRGMPDIEGAYAWAHANTWEILCAHWIKIVDAAAEVAAAANAPRVIGRAERRAAQRAAKKKVKA